MPEYLAPGVYVEEVSFTTGPIESRPTGVAGFVGELPDGPPLLGVEVGSPHDLDTFGAGARSTPTGEAVLGFLDNGGRRAQVVRVPSVADTADVAGGLRALVPAGIDLLSMPDTAPLDTGPGLAVIAEGTRRAEEAGWTYLIDPPAGEDATRVATALSGSAAAVLHVPRLLAADGGVRPTSGAVAGVHARIDHSHGVWKAPAGVEAVVRGAAGLSERVSDRRREQLAAIGVNVLRALDDGAVAVWGARTLSPEPEWKYVNVRRLVTFVESSLAAGLEWAAHQPNDQRLWAAIREAVEEFLTRLWRQGAFPGGKAEEAFFVRCDRSTMTRGDLDAGRIVLRVGVAPLRPAEFVVVTLGLTTIAALSPEVRRTLSRLDAPAPVLLTGGDRTGRRLTGAHLAHRDGRPLFRVDLSALSSRYIGETEKNLGRVLDRAEKAGAVLFFDEADALFGRRTRTTSAARLRQRLGSHQGRLVVSSGTDDAVATIIRWFDPPPEVLEISPSRC